MNKQNNIPKLRFPEFSGEWNTTFLGKVATFSKGKGIAKDSISEDGLTPCIRYGELYTYYDEIIDKVVSFTNDDDDLVYSIENDVIIPSSGETAIDISTASCVMKSGVALGGDINIIRTKINGIFLSYYLNSKKKLDIANLAQGISIIHLYANQLEKLHISLPLLKNEQNKIANFLMSVEKKIIDLKKMLHLQKKYKQGIMQRIFNQTIRFKDENGNQFPDWRLTKLKEILNEHKVRNVLNQYNEVFSVAKHKGVINQLEHLGRSYAAEDTTNYKVVYPGDIVYTKSPTSDFPFGIVKQNKLDRTGIVSVLYAVFSPINKYIGYIIDVYFSSPANTYNYLNPIVHRGAKNTMNIANDTFIDGASILLPTDINEQKKIVMFLNNIDAKIEATQKQMDIARLWKKGLLQQMFV